MIRSLVENGLDVIECHESLWNGIKERDDIISGGWKSPFFWVKLVGVYIRLLSKYLHLGAYDLMVVGYPGHLDVPIARILCWFKKRRLVWDFYISSVLVAKERKYSNRLSFSIIKMIESFSVKLPDLLLTLTPEYSDWVLETYSLQNKKVVEIPLSADEVLFEPRGNKKNDNLHIFRCLYFGSFLPNHGVKYILGAANLLSKDGSIHFELVGKGPGYEECLKLAKQMNLTNVTFSGWIPIKELTNKIASSDVCLGTFGDAIHTRLTIQNKVLEALSMAKPVITGNSPIIRRVFDHGVHLAICERKNSKAIADAILKLQSNPEMLNILQHEGHQRYQEFFSNHVVGDLFSKILNTTYLGNYS
jgi:glycosyltransferase involved in cell wall biosynthesis